MTPRGSPTSHTATCPVQREPVLRIRIRLCMFLGLQDLDPDPLVRGTGPQHCRKCTRAGVLRKRSLVYRGGRLHRAVPLLMSYPQRTSVGDPDPHVFGPQGSRSGSIIQRWIRILPFSHKSVERTEIMPTPRGSTTSHTATCPIQREPVFVIRIRMFLGLQDPDPDPLVRGADPPMLAEKYFNTKC
jgi:hypothetical protein